jgi:hypothetical protein
VNLLLRKEKSHEAQRKHLIAQALKPPCTDAILIETCHHMRDGSYCAGGRDGQERFAEGR